MATELVGPRGHGGYPDAPIGDNMDAEFEEEEINEHFQTPGSIVDNSQQEDADLDAEGEEVDEEELGPNGNDEVAQVAVQGPDELEEDASEEDDDKADGDAEVDESADAESSDDGAPDDADSSSEDSDAEGSWEGDSDTAEDARSTVLENGICIFCKQKEDDDPSEEFEEYLACAVCGDNAHRQCARDANSLKPDDDIPHWRCLTCLENGCEEDDGRDFERETSGRQSSIPKMSRDLLPTKIPDKPDSHSIFNTLIQPDDPLDGSRSLRKRKESPLADQTPAFTTRKRRKASDPTRSPSPADSVTRSPTSARKTLSTRSKRRAVTTEAEQDSDEDDESPKRTTRPRRSRQSNNLNCGASVILNDGISLVVGIKVQDKAQMKKILSARPRKKKYSEKDRSRKTQTFFEEPEVSHYPSIQNSYAPFLAFHDRENEDGKPQKPYGGILSEADADTSKTFPQEVDRKKFEHARLKAEEDWKKKIAEMNSKSEPIRTPHKQAGPPSKIKCINFGGYEIDTWHAAPYPEEYTRNKVLYICEFCLKYMSTDFVAWRHKLKCPGKHPPGDEIYRDGKFSFFEVDGRKNPVYCQNLCLLAKLFLGSKTLYYDVEPFLFYVMTENNEFGCHFIGYFSKEKRPTSMNNVSCILTLPIHQRKGFGHMLMDFSYLLTKVEKKTGSPEKPLSDMGLVSYRSYWRLVLCYEFLDQTGPLSINDISERTGMTPDDIISTLEGLRALVRDPVTKTYALRLDYTYYREYVEKFEAKQYPKIDSENLLWVPYIMKGQLAQYEDAPAIHAIAPREEETDEKPEEGVQQQVAQEAAKENEKREQESTTELNTPKAEPPAEPETPLPDGETEKTGPAPESQLLNGILDAAAKDPAPIEPEAEEASSSTPHIPPNRFEIFPPIPGQPAQKQRRSGRPFGSRRRTQTPLRRATSLRATGGKNLSGLDLTPNGNGSPLVNGTRSTLRRTRSKLGEVMVNGDFIQNEDAVAEEDEEEIPLVNGDHHSQTPSRMSRTASNRTGSSRSDKGKGRADVDGDITTASYEEAHEDVIIEEEDADAEGEVDEDILMGDADADAEGEPEEDADGDDVDAEGEPEEE